MMIFILPFAILMNTATASDTVVPAATAKNVTVSASTEAPEPVTAVKRMLSAHHPEDLPTGEEWRQFGDASAPLLWLAENGRLNYERERAMSALRHYPSAAAKQLLLKAAIDPETHFLVRMGAVRGLGGQHLKSDDCRALTKADHSASKYLKQAIDKLLNGPACQEE